MFQGKALISKFLHVLPPRDVVGPVQSGGCLRGEKQHMVQLTDNGEHSNPSNSPHIIGVQLKWLNPCATFCLKVWVAMTIKDGGSAMMWIAHWALWGELDIFLSCSIMLII